VRRHSITGMSVADAINLQIAVRTTPPPQLSALTLNEMVENGRQPLLRNTQPNG
jgi:hypothetical protein